MTGESIYAKNTEVSVVAVDANSDEDITEGDKVSKANEASYEMEIDL